jgi:peptidoglycan/xylan/chitin deacetylase (PgdA/CDA1 family)
MLKSKTSEEIENYIINIFGDDSFKPISDIDRPFTPLELRDFSREEQVFIGNHTCDHAILINHSSNEIKSQLFAAQDYLTSITGVSPLSVSYPNGYFSGEIVRISKDVGCKLGFTLECKKNYLPINCQDDGCMCLSRFAINGSNNIEMQCELFRSDKALYPRFSNFISKTY